MIKTYTANGVVNLELYFEGNANIIFNKSNSNSLSTKIDYLSNTLVFKENNSNGNYKLTIEDPNKSDNLKHFMDVFNNVNSFKDIVKNISSLSLDTENEVMNIEVELPSSLGSFNFKLNNGLAKFNFVNTKVLDIKGNNLSLDLNNDISIVNANIKINNSNIEMAVNNKLNNMDIKGNKGNLSFYRDKNANDIGIQCKGNNIIKEGVLETSNNIIKCKLNSGIIKVN